MKMPEWTDADRLRSFQIRRAARRREAKHEDSSPAIRPPARTRTPRMQYMRQALGNDRDECSERLRVEALARKKHEEQGNAWSHRE